MATDAIHAANAVGCVCKLGLLVRMACCAQLLHAARAQALSVRLMAVEALDVLAAVLAGLPFVERLLVTHVAGLGSHRQLHRRRLRMALFVWAMASLAGCDLRGLPWPTTRGPSEGG